MDSKDLWIGVLGLLGACLVSLAILFGMFKLGRIIERRELTASLINQMENAVEDGVAIGYSQCMKEVKDKYDLEPMFSGRY